MMKKIISGVMVLLLASITGAMAQTRVTGKVTTDDGPLAGALVSVRGTGGGTATDNRGEYSVSVSDLQNGVLEFTFLGYTRISENIDGRTVVDVKMEPEPNSLDEVVVIGYGVQKKGNITGSIASVSAKALEKTPAVSVAEAMVGKLPGVQITQMDGSPDSEITIRVRGGGSITEDNSPLILLDGFEIASLNDVPTADVESVEVLKDASSTAIYGARGANGVVLITSKQPQEGRINVNVHTYTQIKTLARKLNVMDPYEFVHMQYEYDRQRSSNPTGFFNKYGHINELYIYQGIPGVDWQDELFGTNPVSWYLDANVSGGTAATKYKFTLIHQDQPGVLINNGMQQTNINVAVSTKIWKKLTLDFKSRFVNNILDGKGTEGVSLLTALRQAPTEGLDDLMKLPDDNTYYDPDQFEEVTRFNPIEEAERNFRQRTTRTYFTMFGLGWDIADGLKFRTEYGFEYRNQKNNQFWGLDTGTARGNNNQPVAEIQTTEFNRWQLTNTLTYNLDIAGKHSFDFLLGQEIKSDESRMVRNRYRYFPENMTSGSVFDNLTMGSAFEPNSNTPSPNRISSVFARVFYNYGDRYLATFTVRADGSSKFAKGRRWGAFPAASVAWRINNESFLKDYKPLSNLKLRLDFGIAGNDRISGDLFEKYYGVSRNRSVGWGEEEHYYYNYYNTNYLYNRNIKWETTITRNIGLDFGFLNERISGSLDFYWNTTKDLLVPSSIPGHTGFTSIMTNVGQTSNQGVEFNMSAWLVDRRNWSLSVDFNIGYNRNRIDKLASGEKEWILSSGWAGTQLLNTDDYRAIVGSQKGLIYGFVNDGFYTMDDFESFDPVSRSWTLKEGVANSTNLSGAPRPGNAKFKKLTPVNSADPNTWVIGDNDRTVIGNTNPKFSGGFGVNATWKGFDLSLFFNYMVGFDVFNANKVRMTSWWENQRHNLGMEVSMDKRWRNFDDMGNEIRYEPAALAKFNENATMWNPTSIGRPIAMSYAVEDGSFLRLNTASLGYTIPKRLTEKIRIQRLRVYFTGYNLFVLTAYSGYDPEVNIERGLTPAIDHNSYPRSRTYTFGLQISL